MALGDADVFPLSQGERSPSSQAPLPPGATAVFAGRRRGAGRCVYLPGVIRSPREEERQGHGHGQGRGGRSATAIPLASARYGRGARREITWRREPRTPTEAVRYIRQARRFGGSDGSDTTERAAPGHCGAQKPKDLPRYGDFATL